MLLRAVLWHDRRVTPCSARSVGVRYHAGVDSIGGGTRRDADCIDVKKPQRSEPKGLGLFLANERS